MCPSATSFCTKIPYLRPALFARHFPRLIVWRAQNPAVIMQVGSLHCEELVDQGAVLSLVTSLLSHEVRGID